MIKPPKLENIESFSHINVIIKFYDALLIITYHKNI
jgi:hypothetical protein